MKRIEQEIAEREAALEHQREVDAVTRDHEERMKELDLAERKRAIIKEDIQLAADYMQLVRQIVEDEYGPDWRNTEAGQLAYRERMASGNQVLELMASNVIGPGRQEIPEQTG